MSLADPMAEALGLGSGTATILLAIAGLLTVGTVKRGLWLLRSGADDADRRRWRSVLTWWVLFLLMGTVLVLGRGAVTLLMASLSLLLLREGLPLAGAESHRALAAVGVGAVYLWAWLDWTGLFLRAVPLLAAIWLLVELVGRWRSGPGLGRGRAVGRAVLLTVVGPSFVAGAASLPPPESLPTTGMGWLVLLAVLTELNDSAQSWWGRNLGARQMAPRISPRKTWEGLVGGLATTTLAAVLLAPLVTSYGRAAPSMAGGVDGTLGPPWLWSAALGLVVGLAGTAGDLSASILKRRAGVKDSGTLLPGHGGVLDRFDSLAVSAPVYFYVTWLLWHAAL
ncbi:MAG: phosphatidate cytidylyltransferase [Gemmatimonadota bacterium]